MRAYTTVHVGPGDSRRTASFRNWRIRLGRDSWIAAAQRVAGERCGCGRGGALSDHVADRHGPGSVVVPEPVVEVATDEVALAGGAEVDRDLDPGDLGRVREQALLERARDVLEVVLGSLALRHDRSENERREARDAEIELGEQQAVIRASRRTAPCRSR